MGAQADGATAEAVGSPAGPVRGPRSWRTAPLLILALAWLGFQLFILVRPQVPMVERPVHLGFALLVFLLAPRARPRSEKADRADGVLAGGVVAVLAYYLAAGPRLGARMEGVDPVLGVDLVFSFALVAIVLECVRRVVGWSLLGVILAFLAFATAGRVVPGWTGFQVVPELFKFSGFTPAEAAENFTLTPNGLLGVTTSTSVSFVFYFVLLGAVYSGIGGGQWFIDIGLRVSGRQRGGAAKAAVVSSGLMGSISGSAVANVATTGLFTIPLMRRAGYTPSMAGAVEAIASTGGQLMPPVMGVAAFVMADFLQMDYGAIAWAGLIPALAFYGSVILAVDLHARRRESESEGEGESESESEGGIEGEGEGDERGRSIGGRAYLVLPLVLLIGLLFGGFSASLCAVSAMGACLAIGLVRRELTARDWLGVILKGVRQAAEVAIPIAAIGLIVEVAVQSNLVLKFSVSLIELGGGTLLGALFWIVFGCILMGMGLPTVAAYIIGATLFVQPLLEFGLPLLGAHFFVMYYCVLSMVTPPVALASYTAATLAGAPLMETCLRALRLGAVAFVIPFAFIFSPGLLGQGPAWAVAASVVNLAAGITLWALALEGYFRGRVLGALPRCCLGALGLLLVLLPALTGAGGGTP